MFKLEHYRNKILTISDKANYKWKINRNVVFIYLGLLVVITIVLLLLVSFVYMFFDNSNYRWFLGYFYGGFSLAAVLLMFADKNDVLKKHSLNEKLFILVSFLEEELNKDKVKHFTRIRFNYIVSRIIRNLYILEQHMNNRFIFLTDKNESILIEKIINFMQFNIHFLLRQKKVEEINKVLQLVNELYALSTYNQIIYSPNEEKLSKDVQFRYEELDSLLEGITSMVDSDKNEKPTMMNKISYIVKRSIQAKWFKVAIFIFLNISIFCLMVLYKDITYIPAIVTVIAFSFGVLSLMLQTNGNSNN